MDVGQRWDDLKRKSERESSRPYMVTFDFLLEVLTTAR